MTVNDTCQDSQIPNNNNYLFKSQLNNRILIYIYQITCKDPTIKENYIGQTDFFERRKDEHSKDSEKSNLKVYKIIRKHGGWNNWNIKILNHYYCKDEHESRQIEQKYIDIFKATMNSIRACSKSDIDKELDRQLEFELKDFSNKILGCYLYDYYFDSNLEYEQSLECEFCKKILSTIYSLKIHQKTVKSCLKIQGNLNNAVYLSCEYCDKKFTIKNNLISHYKTCKEKKYQSSTENKKDKEIQKLKDNNDEKDKEIQKLKDEHYKILTKKELEIKKDKIKMEKYKKEIDKLKEELYDMKGQLKILTKNNDCLFDIAKQPKISHTNNKILSIQSHLDFSNTEYVKQLIDEKYDKKYLFQGQKGVAQFAVDYILKDDTGQLKYVCTDPSRQIFKYKDSEGFIKKDVEAKKLTGFLVNSGIQEKTHDVAIDFWTDENGDVDGEKCSVLLEPAQSIKNIKHDNTAFKKELVNITTL